MGFKLNNIAHIFALLCAINMLNYIDRGIIPGAPVEFQAFVQETVEKQDLSAGTIPADHSNVSTYIGLLVSAFIASYSVFICIFGYMSMTRRPFLLSAIGLFIWVIAIVLCGLAKPLKSFYVLLIGRLLSGIGESSFHATTPPFIDEFAPPKSRTLWLGIFYCGISVGTALGYTYGGLMAKIWDWGFYLTAIVMFPMAYACWQWIPLHYDYPLAHNEDAADHLQNRNSLMGPGAFNQAEIHAEVAKEASALDKSPSVLAEMFGIVKDPMFITATLGVAAYSFTLAGMGAFAPAILIGYGILNESIASTAFGGIAVLSGIIGSPLGGWLIDYQSRGHEDDETFRLYVAARQMIVFMSIGVGFAFLSLFFMDNSIAFLGCLLLALTFVFTTQSAQTLVILYSVSKHRRGVAMGLNTFLLHLVGDVPSPVILGALKDKWAPNCGSVYNELDEAKLNPKCSQDKDGLRNVLFFSYAWLLWAVLTWAASFLIARYRLNHRNTKSQEVETPVVT
ncbi:hypothetical protein DYB25_003420 [Aphanomyces astaci]|uniref:Major facilitator superfamily (MFS) profile domain-containing protein n=1 Tax=Aphanomyces astaci TaxID=112090 RepID=A0A397AT10_APHAT|nr:hypothetical protein DYB25_003420 [Aphanomyces astaci]RHY63284.1 hypothetical protein DYB30_003223 [Aphanomyces astaci]RHZ07842.1 hypothetical protein DYB26_007174 [Aphanomyces astaci]RHZ32923.1 hypothetical protein DYB31_005606 [Aphanomyces astaci]